MRGHDCSRSRKGEGQAGTLPNKKEILLSILVCWVVGACRCA